MRTPSDYYYFIATTMSGMSINPSKKHPFYVYLNSGFQMVGWTVHSILLFLFLLSDLSLMEKLSTIQFFVTMIHIVVRHLNVLIRRKLVYKIMHRLDTIWEEGRKENLMPEEYKKIDNHVTWFLATFLFVYLGSCPLAAIECIFKNWGKEVWNVGPLPVYQPFPYSMFWCNYVLQLTAYFCGLMSICSSLCCLFVMTQYTAFCMKCLQALFKQKDLKALGNRPYQLHQELLGLVDDLNSLLGTVYFIEMVINGFEVAARVLSIFWELRTGNTSNLISFVILVLLTTITPFILTLGGTEITTESENIYKAAYESNWYVQDVKTRKQVLLLMSMATKPVYFHFRYLLTFQLQQFTSFVQGVYSYVMLLRFFGAGS